MSTVTIETIKDLHHKAFHLFDYDKNHTGKAWEDHSEDVLKGKRFKGVCSDFTTTCANLALKAGFQSDQIKIVICMDEVKEEHGVCAVTIDGQTWCMDNRSEIVYEWHTKHGYVWQYSMALNHAGEWHKIV